MSVSTVIALLLYTCALTIITSGYGGCLSSGGVLVAVYRNLEEHLRNGDALLAMRISGRV
jgi:hypothetical protein